MVTRKDLEQLGIEMTEEQWKTFRKQLGELEEKIWDEEHPLDD